MEKKKIVTILAFIIWGIGFSQTGNVGVGTSSPDGTAKLDINTSSDAVGAKKGLLIPRVALTSTKDQNTVHLPTTSVLVYNTTAANTGDSAVVAGFYYWNSTLWVRMLNNASAWLTLGNTATTAPGSPATYGTTAFAAGENFLGTTDAQPLTLGTSNIERARLTSDGRLGIGTDAPAANTLLTITPYANTLRNGIYMPYPGSGTISSSAIGINIPVTTNEKISGFKYSNSTTAAGVFYGVGVDLTGGTLATGYLGYRSSSPKTYAVYGIGGDYAAYFQGKAVITSDNSPNSTADLEVQNTTSSTSPVTFSMRPNFQLNTSTDILASLNFADNRTSLAPQAQILVVREAAATSGAGSTDLPSAFTFWTTPDGASGSLTERLRISNYGNVGIGTAAPDVSAKLELNTGSDGANTKRGFLAPQIALASTTDGTSFSSLSPVGPAPGLLIYNTATAGSGATAVFQGFYYNSNTKTSPVWKRFSTGNDEAWIVTGNQNTASPGTPSPYGSTAIGPTENFIGTRNNVDVVFGTNNFERMRLQQSGQLSIGSSVAGSKLDIHQTTSTAVMRLYNYANTPEVEFRRPSGTQTSPSATAASTVGRIWGQGYDGTTYRDLANISFDAEATTASGSSPGRIVFRTTPSGTVGVAERMRIDNAGNVIIGTGEGTNTVAGNTLRGSNGSGSNIAGSNLTITSGNGTGTGGSGYLSFQTAPVAGSSSSPNSMTERLRITNTGAFLVNGTAGTTGQVLTSNSSTSSPTWQSPYGLNVQFAKGTSDISINSATFADMTGMTITFTPNHSTVFINFGASGDMSFPCNESYVKFKIVKDGTDVASGGTVSLATDYDDVTGTASAWGAHFSMFPVTVTPGTLTTIKIQWLRSGLNPNSANNNASSTVYSHRNLTIWD